MSGVKIGGKNVNNLRYAYDTVLLAENQSELQIVLPRSFRTRSHHLLH